MNADRNAHHTFFPLDDNGIPTGAIDSEELNDKAVLLGFRLAAHSHDADALIRIATETRNEAGAEMFRAITAGALWVLVANVIEPLLKVTDECHRVGLLDYDLRAGLHANLEDVETTLGGEQ